MGKIEELEKYVESLTPVDTWGWNVKRGRVWADKSSLLYFVGEIKKQLEPSLPTQQDKIVVPEFVAEWIEYAKKKGHTLFESARPFELYGVDYLRVGKWIKENEDIFARAWLDGYTVEKEELYWAVMGVTDYFRCDGKIIVFTKEEEAVEVANLIGINTRAEQLKSYDPSDCVLIDELRATI